MFKSSNYVTVVCKFHLLILNSKVGLKKLYFINKITLPTIFNIILVISAG